VQDVGQLVGDGAAGGGVAQALGDGDVVLEAKVLQKLGYFNGQGDGQVFRFVELLPVALIAEGDDAFP